MVDIPAVRAQLETAKRKEEIIRLAAGQVVRDFERFGLDVKFSGKASEAYEELFIQLKQHIEVLLESQSGRLGALLYQIDVNQKKASRIIGRMQAAEELTHMILEREFIKVLTRIYFRDNPSLA
jgi:hypothetical protein